MPKYKKYEYCEASGCGIFQEHKTTVESCKCCGAYQFHDYLSNQGYEIIKADRLSFLEEGNKAMESVFTKIADYLEVEQGNVEQLLETIEDLKEFSDQLKLEELLDRTRREERRRMWEKINSHIKEGKLAGNGFDKTAERNGLIHAANIILSFGI